MNLQKTVLRSGNETNFPSAGDVVGVHYIGWLYQPGAPNDQGQE